ncbi:MAG: carbamoyltransferase HypF [Anaerolineaceae bacterium]|nr:carbamoyltransferase HypF [Anaerolineaceae bacterium]
MGKAIHITGVVQGVGFRPFVYNLARQHGLVGWVRNTSAGVDIRAEGTPEALQAFVAALTTEAPPLARIDSLTAQDTATEVYPAFEIQASAALEGAFQPISADIAICNNCLRELRDPADRRYRYPFINCTHCGPRFTLIKDIPYDRPLTTMADFPLCPDCAAEYHDPADRRFHAQPVACAACGPEVWLEQDGAPIHGDDALHRTVVLLQQGAIVAVKGLGGFHLACDATNPVAVAELRRRKGRAAKPFALMMADLDMIRQHCTVSEAEAKLLKSPASPIVLLNRRRGDTRIAPEVAPGQATLGVMLPYTPLHVLLLDEGVPPLVMTSGNLSEEPIVTDNAAARERLAGLADAFLMHNRDIHIRTDDSVMRAFEGGELPLRRSRGYAPYPVRLPFDLPPILAVGGELKNTFCLTRENYAFMSHHIGDMDNYETLRSFESGITHFERLFRITPEIIVYDLHPDYRATRYAQERAAAGIPAVVVQHHHAHIAAVMAEHGLTGERPVIGVCFDGTGYGTDGTIWGGEFLVADYAGFERPAYLKPVRLPGGDAATRKPARIGLSYLLASGVPPEDDLPPLVALSEKERHTVTIQSERGLNAPLTSSVGRLFDAVSALLDICQVATYEGQAAIELEAAVAPDEPGAYPFTMDGGQVDSAPAIQGVVVDWRAGVSPAVIAARFHNSVAAMIRDVCLELEARYGLHEVALSGGVFQNVTLLGKTLPLLREAGFTVYTHRLVPPNDGGLALGQAVIAGVRAASGK